MLYIIVHYFLSLQLHHSGGVSSSMSVPLWQPRHQCDSITRLETFRAILEHGASQSQDDASLKHQTSSHMFQEESEEMDL